MLAKENTVLTDGVFSWRWEMFPCIAVILAKKIRHVKSGGGRAAHWFVRQRAGVLLGWHLAIDHDGHDDAGCEEGAADTVVEEANGVVADEGIVEFVAVHVLSLLEVKTPVPTGCGTR